MGMFFFVGHRVNLTIMWVRTYCLRFHTGFDNRFHLFLKDVRNIPIPFRVLNTKQPISNTHARSLTHNLYLNIKNMFQNVCDTMIINENKNKLIKQCQKRRKIKKGNGPERILEQLIKMDHLFY